MNEETAAKLSDRLWKVHGELNDILWLVKANCDESEFLRIRKEIASAIGTIDLEILLPIYRQYPHLEPQESGSGTNNGEKSM